MTTATIVYDEEQMESLELADEFFNMAEHNMEAVQETVSDTIISLRTTLADELHTRDESKVEQFAPAQIPVALDLTLYGL